MIPYIQMNPYASKRKKRLEGFRSLLTGIYEIEEGHFISLGHIAGVRYNQPKDAEPQEAYLYLSNEEMPIYISLKQAEEILRLLK